MELMELLKWGSALLIPVGLLFQVVRIYQHKEVRDLSLFTCIFFTLAYITLTIEAHEINSTILPWSGEWFGFLTHSLNSLKVDFEVNSSSDILSSLDFTFANSSSFVEILTNFWARSSESPCLKPYAKLFRIK